MLPSELQVGKRALTAVVSLIVIRVAPLRSNRTIARPNRTRVTPEIMLSGSCQYPSKSFQ